MTLVKIVKDWDWPDLMRQTPGQKGVWDGIRFTLDPVEECDFLVMLNNRIKTDTIVKCPKENVWAIMQEPYMKGFTDWMAEKHEHFSKVFTHHLPTDDPKYVASHPALPWHVNRTFDQLVSSQVSVKSRKLSWIVGNAKDLPGHMKRWSFLEHIKQDRTLDIDLFGRAVKFIEDKWDGLAPYKYSLAVENTRGPDYWTEKVADCFLSWTVPLCYGCTNMEDYFPKGSFIRIDIDQPEECLKRIKHIINEDAWEKRLPDLEEARKSILFRYQLFPYLSDLIHSQTDLKADKRPMVLPGYKRSKKASYLHAVYKLRKMMRLL